MINRKNKLILLLKIGKLMEIIIKRMKRRNKKKKKSLPLHLNKNGSLQLIRKKKNGEKGKQLKNSKIHVILSSIIWDLMWINTKLKKLK